MLNRRGFMGVAAGSVVSSGALAQVANSSRAVGSMRITTLSDGLLSFDISVLSGATPEELASLLHLPGVKERLATTRVNSYLVQTAGENVLIDSGSGPFLGSGLGKVVPALASIGIRPTDIDRLLVTHLHPDHIGGAVGLDGSATFPKAVLHVTAKEHAYWLHPDSASKAPEAVRGFFPIAQNAVSAYKDRLVVMQKDQTGVPGLSVLSLEGHTPGHSGFLVVSGSEKLLVWGDIVNAPEVQLAYPDWTLGVYDFDGQQAARTRRKLLDMVVNERLTVAGMHLPDSGFGTLTRWQNGFRFEAL